MDTPNTTPGPQAATGTITPSGARTLTSRELFRDARVVYIEHRGERYALQLTKQDKLILTK